MKRFILFAVVLFFVLHTYSQKPPLTYDYSVKMLEVSKKQKIGACFLFMVGGVVVARGITAFNTSSSLDDAVSGIGIIMLGGSCVLTSIPLYFYASRNKRRAMSVVLLHQNLSLRPVVSRISGTQNLIQFKVQIGK